MVSFRERYAKYYDVIYSDKDYDSECDFIEAVFRKYAGSKVTRVLDLSCGTGGHSIQLARRGYSIMAVDNSPHMMRLAKYKAVRAKVSIDFRKGDMTTISVPGKFDACFSMFDSIDYLREEKDVLRTFERVATLLQVGGVFVVQFWNGPAVLKIGPQQRHKVVEQGKLKIVRLSDPTWIRSKDKCNIHYRTLVIRGNSMVDDFREVHQVRYFWPDRIRSSMAKSGLSPLKILKPFNLEREASDDDWSVIALASKEQINPGA